MNGNHAVTRTCPLGLLLVLGLLGAAPAATYYIDFDGGRDDHPGTAPDQAFKHCPGDPAAADSAAKISLVPGDTVIFKGGVVYRGTIAAATSGAEGRPIVYDGNTAGKFGQGRAIIDGSELLTGWKQCASAAECGGNPHWQNIYYTSVPKGVSLFGVNLTQGHASLSIAQDPKPADPFFEDVVDSWQLIVAPAPKAEGANTMTYRDADYFKQTDPHFWDGAYFVIYARTNVIYYQKMLSFDPAEHKVTFELLKAEQYKVGGTPPGRFSMMNCLGILGRPGEFVLEEKPQADGTQKLYVWPLEGQTGPAGIGRAVHPDGFAVKAHDVTIQGFLIERQGNAKYAHGVTGSGCSNIVVRDNEITLIRAGRNQVLGFDGSSKITLTGNFVHENRRAGGISMNKCTDALIGDNRLHKNGATGLVLFGCHNVKVSHNTVTDHKGMHANGLTAYLWCSEITFEGNRVSGGNAALTLQEGENFTVADNVFDGGGKDVGIAFWNIDNLKNVRVLNNLLLNGNHKSGIAAAIYANQGKGPMVGYVIKNNIIDGTELRQGEAVERSNNIYTFRGESEKQAGWQPGPGEIVVEDLGKIFVDPAKGDYRLRPGSPAIGAGAEVGLDKDIVGAKVPQDKAPDIGAYEFKP